MKKTHFLLDVLLILLTFNLSLSSQISVNISASDSTVCDGQIVTFSALATGGTGTYTYLWSNQNGDTTQVINDSIICFQGCILTYSVTATDGLGLTDTASIQILVNPNPFVNLGSALPPICSGSLFTAIAYTYSTPSYPPYTYTWDVTGNITGDSISWYPITTTNFHVTVTDANSCTGTANNFINVYPSPVVNLGNDTLLCYGVSYFLDVTQQGGGQYGYSWNTGSYDPYIYSDGYSSPNTYSVQVTDFSSPMSCTASDTIIITLNPEIIADLGIDTFMCIGSSYLIDPIVSGGIPQYSYSWNVGGLIDTSITVNTSIPTFYQVTITDTYNCSVIGYKFIDVPFVEIQSFDTVYCPGNNPISLQANTYGGGAAVQNVPQWNGSMYSFNSIYSYNWSTGSTNSYISVSPSNDSIYYVTVTELNTSCTATDSITIYVPQPLTANIIGDTIICINTYDTITALVSGGLRSYYYTWSDDISGQNIISTDSSIVVNPSILTTYYVTITESSNCSSMTFTSSINVNVVPNNLTVTISNDDTICSGSLKIIQSTVTGGNTPFSYQWSNASTTPDINVFPTTTTSYYVIVTDTYNCADTSLTNKITVNPLPNISASSNSPICSGDTLKLYANGGISYLWTGPNSFNSTLQNPSLPLISAIFSGLYIVTVTDSNGCSDDTSLMTIINSLPTVTFTGTLTPQCENSTAFTLTGGNPTGGTYSGIGVSGTNFNATLAGSSGSPYTITYTYTDVNGCTDTALNNIQVNNLPIPITNSNSPVCYGDTLKLNCIGGDSYLWDNLSGFVSNLQNPEIPGFISYSTYYVTVTDTNGCTAIDSVNAILQPLSTLTGMLKFSGGTISSANALIELYIEVDSLFELYDTISYSNGFTFNNLLPGNYILKVVINDTNYLQLISTYYDSAYTWQQADTLTIGCNSIINKIVTMYEFVPQNSGTGEISGNIYFIDNTGSKAVGEPVSGAEVFLEQEPGDEPICNTETDSLGYYEFDNIPIGHTYKLNVDITGFPLFSTYNLNVTTNSFSFKHIDFVVDTSDTGRGIYRTGSAGAVGMIEFSDFTVNIYPNPFKNCLNINYNLNKTSSVSIEIFDALGRKIETIVTGIQKDGNYSYKFNSKKDAVQNGIYIIKFIVNNTVYLKKIIESK